jgi:hypothetical protein
MIKGRGGKDVLFAHVLEQNFEQWRKSGVEKNSVLFAHILETNDEMKKNGFASSSRYGKELFNCLYIILKNRADKNCLSVHYIKEQGGQDDIVLVQTYRILWRINAVAR